jgi:TPR repeat protein
VTKDEAEAVKWFRKAAEQGFSFAQINLGHCYANGEGVAKDEVEAYAYWNLAAASNGMARGNIASLERKLSRDEIAAGQRRSKEIQKVIAANQPRQRAK